MTPDDELTAALRGALRDGCTVAQVVRRAEELAGDGVSRPRLARLVRQAFGLSPGGWYVLPATESFGTGDVPDSKLTWVFLPDILANRPAWDTDPDREPAWYDGLEKTPLDDLKVMAATSHGVSPEGIAALGEKDREQVIFLEKMRLTLGENVQLLAALAERLQRRVNELEQQPAAVGTGTTEQQPT
jgi:hypothetical protein